MRPRASCSVNLLPHAGPSPRHLSLGLLKVAPADHKFLVATSSFSGPLDCGDANGHAPAGVSSSRFPSPAFDLREARSPEPRAQGGRGLPRVHCVLVDVCACVCLCNCESESASGVCVWAWCTHCVHEALESRGFQPFPPHGTHELITKILRHTRKYRFCQSDGRKGMLLIHSHQTTPVLAVVLMPAGRGEERWGPD